MVAEHLTIPATQTIEEIGLLTKIAEGGSAEIWSSEKFPGLVLKKYVSPEDFSESSRKLINISRGSSSPILNQVRSRVSLPVAEVRSHEQEFMGVLIPLVPQSYKLRLQTGNETTLDLGYMLYAERSERLGVSAPTYATKVKFLAHLAQTLSYLEELGLVHEDLSARNILWSQEQATSYLLDADALASADVDLLPPKRVTPGWVDPRLQIGEISRPDKLSHSYSLGKIASSILSDGSKPNTQDSTGGPFQPQELMDLVDRSLGPAVERPSITVWLAALYAILEQPGLGSNSSATKTSDLSPKPLKFSGMAYETKERIAVSVGSLIGIASAIALVIRVTG